MEREKGREREGQVLRRKLNMVVESTYRWEICYLRVMVIGGVQSPGIQMENPGVTCKGLKRVVLSRQHGGQLARAETGGGDRELSCVPAFCSPSPGAACLGTRRDTNPQGFLGKASPLF